MKILSIIKRPVITEKSQIWEQNSVYTVMVDKTATKVDIKNAFFKLYWVKVEAVRVLNTREKFKFGKKSIIKKKGIERKAMVTLAKWEDVIDFIQIKK